MKVVHLNLTDSRGGAARAAFRVHQSLSLENIDSLMYVNNAESGEWSVLAPLSRWEKVSNIFRQMVAIAFRSLLRTENHVIHSPSILGSRWPKIVNESDADIVHLHWTGSEMLSIRDVKKIKKPLVWTLHDMWAFSGAEHYAEDFRWREGYTKTNRPHHESGFDLNRWTWRRKKKLWTMPIQLVTPSQWKANCAQESVLLGKWPVEVIPHPIDLKIWNPVPQRVARDALGLPKDIPLVLFGAQDGGKNPRKGFDLLIESLGHLQDVDVQLVVFGEPAPRMPIHFGFPTHYTGKLEDDFTLRFLYSAADVFALPSRQDNLPLTAVESLACGLPVVAFDNAGVPTVIEHRKNGFLATAFDTQQFAEGMRWAVTHKNSMDMRKSIRKFAELNFDPAVISAQYRSLYARVLKRNEGSGHR